MTIATCERGPTTARGRATDRLAKAAKAAMECGEPATDEIAALLEAVAPMVGRMARKVAGRRPSAGCDGDDLRQVAAMEMPRIVRNYRPDRGAFTTHLASSLPHYLKRARQAQERPIRVPRHVLDAGRPAPGSRCIDPGVLDRTGAATDRDDSAEWATIRAAMAGLPDDLQSLVDRVHGLDGEPAETFPELSRRLGMDRHEVRWTYEKGVRAIRRAVVAGAGSRPRGGRGR